MRRRQVCGLPKALRRLSRAPASCRRTVDATCGQRFFLRGVSTLVRLPPEACRVVESRPLQFKDLAVMPIDFQQARHAMVEQQVRPWDVLDPRVLDTLMRVQREDFVPPRHRKLAFADLALPLEHGEAMLKPVLEGRMMQALALEP